MLTLNNIFDLTHTDPLFGS